MTDAPTMNADLTRKQVAEILNVDERTVSRLVDSGRLRGYRIHRSLRITQEALAEFRNGAAA
jgi:excisionase family DNA binding protein